VIAEGDFFTSYLGVEGLNGSMRGAGSDATHIYSLPEGLDCPGHLEATGETAMVTFGGGDILLSGLSIGVGGDRVCEAPWIDIEFPDGTGVKDGSIEAIVVMPYLPTPGVCPEPLPTAVRASDIAVDGDLFYDFESPIEVWEGFSHGILVAPAHQGEFCPDVRLTGDVVVQDSYFEDVVLAVATAMVDDSNVRVIGNEVANSLIGVVLPDMSGSDAVVARNDMDVIWTGVLGIVDEFPGDEPVRIDVRNNFIRARDIADGIVMIDFAAEMVGEPRIEATIIANDIEMVDTPYNGIFVLGDNDGVIARNHIYGSGSVGVGVFADSWNVIHNDLAGLDAWDADVLVLGNQNRIVCLSSSDEVLDLGFENTVIGCSLLAGAESPQASDRGLSQADYVWKGIDRRAEHGW
jgi:hypothetical protein